MDAITPWDTKDLCVRCMWKNTYSKKEFQFQETLLILNVMLKIGKSIRVLVFVVVFAVEGNHETSEKQDFLRQISLYKD